MSSRETSSGRSSPNLSALQPFPPTHPEVCTTLLSHRSRGLPDTNMPPKHRQVTSSQGVAACLQV